VLNIFEEKIGGRHREVPGEDGMRKGRRGISAVLVHAHTRTGNDVIAARQPHEVTIVQNRVVADSVALDAGVLQLGTNTASVRGTWTAHGDPKTRRCVKETGRPIQRSRGAAPPARGKRLYTCAAAIMAMSQNFGCEEVRGI
jgi:hypothetical protein